MDLGRLAKWVWRAYLPAFSALRLATLGSTTALNFAPATNLGTMAAGILRAAPVAGFLPVRAARWRT